MYVLDKSCPIDFMVMEIFYIHAVQKISGFCSLEMCLMQLGGMSF